MNSVKESSLVLSFVVISKMGIYIVQMNELTGGGNGGSQESIMSRREGKDLTN